MPFAILPEDATVEAALRRIAREEAEGALSEVRGTGPLAPRVHAMRKAVKKLRGLLRLVRPVFSDAKAENEVLRDALELVQPKKRLLRSLSPVRDDTL